MWKLAITLFTLLCFTACTSMQAIPTSDAAALEQNLRPGDQLRVLTADQRRYELTFEKLENDALHGTDRSGKPVHVPLKSVASLEKYEGGTVSPTVKVLLVIGAIGVLAALVGGGGGGGGGGGSGGGGGGY